MFKKFKLWLFKRQISKKRPEISELEKAIDESIINSIKDADAASRLAEKTLKQKILQQQTERTLRKIQSLDENYNNNDEDDDEDDDEEIDIGKIAEKKLLDIVMNKISGNPSSQAVEQVQNKLNNTSINTAEMSDFIKTLTPKQLKILKEKGII